jgi:S-adenosylmethionine/arginine decarboxylase-like enzyme
MFEDKTSSGKHIICDLKRITNSKLLNNKLDLKLLCKNICVNNNFNILGEIDYDFYPQGCSFLFLLSESHLSVHTFPEKNHLAFDLYTCREYENNDKYLEIFFELCEKLGTIPQNCDYKIVNRYFHCPLNNNNDNNTIDIDIDIEPKPFIYL